MADERVRPIFVVGSPRSGTSVLSWCIGQHPNVLALEETNWFAPFAVDVREAFELGIARGERSQVGAMGISRGEFYEHFGDAIHSLIMRYKGRYVERAEPLLHREYGEVLKLMRSPLDPKTRWIDATPEYSFHVFALRQMFPHARFVHIVRDVSAVVHSLMRLRMPDGSTIVTTENEAYLYWLRTVRACLEAERVLGPEAILRIRYSDLIGSPESCLRLCLDFLEESYCPDCLIPLQMKINSSSSLPHPNPDVSPPDVSPIDVSVRQEAEKLSTALLGDEMNHPTVDPPITGIREPALGTPDASVSSNGHSSHGTGPTVSDGWIPLGARLTVVTREPGGEYSGSATIAWDTGNGVPGEVWVALDGAPEVLFAQGARGCQTVPWITSGSFYSWRLYAGEGRMNALASTTIVPHVAITR